MTRRRYNPEFDRAMGQVIATWRAGSERPFAELIAEVGVSQQQWYKYEAGRDQVSTARLVAIAHALGAEPEVLIREAIGAREPSDKTQVQLVHTTRQLRPDQRKALLGVARGMMA